MSITPPPSQYVHKHIGMSTTEENGATLDARQDSRQKRKRTSPHDHTILEAAYQKNSKPDKEERLRLVGKVDLGEKEVQIWFQNRRQNDRRKSKPLQPHELIPHFRNGIPIEAAKQVPSPELSQSVATEALSQMPPSSDDKTSHSSPRTHDVQSMLNKEADILTSSPTAAKQDSSGLKVGVLATPPSSFERRVLPDSAISFTSPALPAQPTVQIAKKRSHEQMNEGQSEVTIEEDSPKDPKVLRRTSSFVRLAVSADGSVKIRTNNEPTPSPPKERPTPPANTVGRRSSGFTRAQSDLNFRDAGAAVPRSLGRSRDARTWEFYCDRSHRSLAVHADEEASGSAVGALGLMRSATPRRPQPMTPNSANQNLFRRTPSTFKSKPGMARAHSSVARLQGSSSVVGSPSKPEKPGLHRRSSGSDSDKENWLPGTRDSTTVLRRTGEMSQRATLLEEQVENDDENGLSIIPSTEDKETKPATKNGKPKVDDLDCVQGLLSLSQGAWR